MSFFLNSPIFVFGPFRQHLPIALSWLLSFLCTSPHSYPQQSACQRDLGQAHFPILTHLAQCLPSVPSRRLKSFRSSLCIQFNLALARGKCRVLLAQASSSGQKGYLPPRDHPISLRQPLLWYSTN